uniref:Uncharacterized protein n=1 Tax=Sphaerodactylus townsendi TaxID=933632 RepID=A0ACB8EN53_9SAUR
MRSHQQGCRWFASSTDQQPESQGDRRVHVKPEESAKRCQQVAAGSCCHQTPALSGGQNVMETARAAKGLSSPRQATRSLAARPQKNPVGPENHQQGDRAEGIRNRKNRLSLHSPHTTGLPSPNKGVVMLNPPGILCPHIPPQDPQMPVIFHTASGIQPPPLPQKPSKQLLTPSSTKTAAGYHLQGLHSSQNTGVYFTKQRASD